MTELEPKIALPAASVGDGGSPKKPSSQNNNVAPDPPPPAATNAPEPTATTTMADGADGGEGDDEDMLLVTEFPPPPYYYTLASRSTPAHLRLTTPPEIPHRAFRVAAKKVNAERRKAREESERIRLEAEKEGGGVVEKSDSAMMEGATGKQDSSSANISTTSISSSSQQSPKKKPSSSSSTLFTSTTTKTEIENNNNDDDDDDSIDPDDPNETVVAVFGEIVEDPTLVVEEECHDPVEIRENVKRLNRAVLNGFLKLVQKLVNDPNDNKKLRDELSHNLFLMLQECNKFREHQAREILIETLEKQLECRREGLASLEKQIGDADDALAALHKFREN